MTESPVLIAGGGIGGLATALTLQQIGVPCVVFEAAREMRPLGVGINMQPNAVRELHDLGITEGELAQVGLPAREWALVGLNGNDIYSEPRGRFAGYNWPQYAVHRGRFHMLLHDKVVERLGPQAIRLGSRVTGYRNNSAGVTAHIAHADGSTSQVRGALLIGRTASTRRCGRRCTRRSRRSTGAARSCGAAPPGASRSAAAPPSSASARIASGSCSIRSRIPIPRPASR
jgi:2-polyprenyl-6-methoxyphenol hydroxylase-like FAD-dependent oxidoreductase